jgi:glycosyltransferase involved in cell wall biosynthesis
MDADTPVSSASTSQVPSDTKLARPALDRSRWHRPRVAVVIANFDYSDFLEDAVLSVVDQSYGNIECIIVDDGSSPPHREQANNIARKFKQHGVNYLSLEENCGQIAAFYAGLDQTSAEFLCLLDPDDRYSETFIELSIEAHLNEQIYCPITTTDQYKIMNDELVNATFAHWATVFSAGTKLDHDSLPLRYFGSDWTGLYWTSTSALMFRRGILELLRPIKSLSYRGEADSYLANGAHMLGGTLFIEQPLVYRQLHQRNAWMSRSFFALDQIKHRHGAEENFDLCKRDVAAAFLENGARDLFEQRFLSRLLYRHFERDSLALLRRESHHAAELAPPGFKEWRRRRRLRKS